MKNIVIAASMLIALSGCAQQPHTPNFSFDGLVYQEIEGFDEVHVAPGFDISQYKSIMVEQGDVSFKPRWAREYNSGKAISQRIRDDDMIRIKKDLAQLMYDQFHDAVGKKSRFTLTETPGAETLLLKPGIINLDMTAPDIERNPATRTYVKSAGELTLYLEVFDSVSGNIVARIIDRKRDHEDVWFDWANRVTNAADARRAARQWTNSLANLFDKL